MSTFKYIYSEEHQALLDQMQEHLDSYNIRLIETLNKKYGEDNCRGQGKGAQMIKNEYYGDSGRSIILDQYVKLKALMIPVRIEFKELGSDV
ncbi:MAG: hypothetical protein JKY50_00755 [Oleispira sp.]|nr:hypothetical protein [Oleispira sp.]